MGHHPSDNIATKNIYYYIQIKVGPLDMAF
jgi:hypothetical protein